MTGHEFDGLRPGERVRANAQRGTVTCARMGQAIVRWDLDGRSTVLFSRHSEILEALVPKPSRLYKPTPDAAA